MAQHVTDLVEGSTPLHEMDRQSVPQHMRTHIGHGWFQACFGKRFLEHRIHQLSVLERTVWHPVGNKEHPRSRHSIQTDLVRQAFAHVLGQRHPVMALALAANHQPTRAPVEILQLQGDHLLRPQSQARRQQE